MIFNVRFVDAATNTLRVGVYEAESELLLRETFLRRGDTVLKATVAREAKVPASEYVLFCREVRTLLNAGMTVVESVDALCARQGESNQASKLLRRVRDRLSEGQQLSTALEGVEGCPSVLVAAVRAGERTSNLVESFDEYLRFEEVVRRLSQKVVSAAIYPALVATLGLGISCFLLLVVLPSFSGMYTNLRGRSGGLSGWLIGLSQWIPQHRFAISVALVVLAAAIIALIHTGMARRLFSTALERIPLVRTHLLDLRLATTYQGLALLLRGGYPLAEALELVRHSASGEQLKAALGRTHHRVVEGTLVSQALTAAGLCDTVDTRLLAAAERSGQFASAAEVVAARHGASFELFIERLTRIVEPVLLLAVAVLVGGIVVAMYMPIFDMATRLR